MNVPGTSRTLQAVHWLPEEDCESWFRIAALTDVALRSSSDDPRLLRWLGVALLSIGREQNAGAVLARAVAQAPDDAQLRILLARALLALVDLDGAKQQIDEALRLAPHTRDARMLLFELLVRTNQWDSVWSLMDEIGGLEPMNTFFCDARLRQEAPRSRLEAQLVLCEAELAANPILTDAIYFKAIALARLGRVREAREVIRLKRFLEIRSLPAPDGFDDTETFRASLAQEIARNPTFTPDWKATRDGVQTRQLRQSGAIHIEALLGQIKAAVNDYAARLPRRSVPWRVARRKERSRGDRERAQSPGSPKAVRRRHTWGRGHPAPTARGTPLGLRNVARPHRKRHSTSRVDGGAGSAVPRRHR